MREQRTMGPEANWDGHSWDDAGRVRHVGECPCCKHVRELTVVILPQPAPGKPRPDGMRVCGGCAPVAIWAVVQSARFSGPFVLVVPISKAVAA